MCNEFVKYVDRRLDVWAKWYRRNNAFGLNFPDRTIEYRLMTEGVVIDNSKPQPLPCHAEAEEIEALVNEMATYENNMAIALREQYFGFGSLIKRAARLGISYEQFRLSTLMARQWLIGRLSAHYKKSKKKYFQKSH